MGNAVCTVNFPNSLTADDPSMTSGKVVSRNVPGMIRLEKREGTACGLEGRITFRKNVLTTQWSYKKTNSSERGLTFTAERSNTVDPIQEKAEVQTKVWIQYHFVILPKVKQRHNVNSSLNLQCLQTLLFPSNICSTDCSFIEYLGQRSNGGLHSP